MVGCTSFRLGTSFSKHFEDDEIRAVHGFFETSLFLLRWMEGFDIRSPETPSNRFFLETIVIIAATLAIWMFSAVNFDFENLEPLCCDRTWPMFLEKVWCWSSMMPHVTWGIISFGESQVCFFIWTSRLCCLSKHCPGKEILVRFWLWRYIKNYWLTIFWTDNNKLTFPQTVQRWIKDVSCRYEELDSLGRPEINSAPCETRALLVKYSILCSKIKKKSFNTSQRLSAQKPFLLVVQTRASGWEFQFPTRDEEMRESPGVGKRLCKAMWQFILDCVERVEKFTSAIRSVLHFAPNAHHRDGKAKKCQ